MKLAVTKATVSTVAFPLVFIVLTIVCVLVAVFIAKSIGNAYVLGVH